MKYRFFSRKNGYENSDHIAKYFYSDIIEDNENITKEFINKSGKEILNNLNNIKNKDNELLINQIEELATTYFNWYYYPHDTQISEGRIYFS